MFQHDVKTKTYNGTRSFMYAQYLDVFRSTVI